MPTLCVQHVPEELYESLRTRARSNRRSISAETISLLENVLPSAKELRRRQAFYRRIQRLRSQKRTPASGAAAEDLLRGDRRLR